MTDLVDPIEEPRKPFSPTGDDEDDLGHGSDPDEDEVESDRRTDDAEAAWSSTRK